ncbi:MAG: hypothetical protein NZ932_03190 [Candidatus Bathyarchaeota archaeon]|nr:hypothetical protein [Candidatus Bathyarchaeota archaeon]
MGFSVTITSSIILIVLCALSTSFLVTIFQGLKEVTQIAEQYVTHGREKLNVALQLGVHSVNATSCVVIVKNVGSQTVFFEDQEGFRWNTIIVSYGNSSFWATYYIEDYTILEIKVSETNFLFTLENHPYIASGEEARIIFSVPEGAPEIPLNGLVSVVFASHYGVAAKAEAVRRQ